MKKTILISLLLACGYASAQSLDQQIGAVDQAVSQQRADQQAQQQAWAEQQAQAQAAAQAAEDRRERQAAADRQRAQARADAANRARIAQQQKADAYADEQRELDLQVRRAQVQAIQARAARENDVINAQLNRSKAETDVLQSNADANRNVSVGIRDNLQDTGKAAVKKASGLFN